MKQAREQAAGELIAELQRELERVQGTEYASAYQVSFERGWFWINTPRFDYGTRSYVPRTAGMYTRLSQKDFERLIASLREKPSQQTLPPVNG